MQQRKMGDLVRDQRPLVLPPDATVQEACAAMHWRRVGAVLVVEDGERLRGIFTGRDAVRCLADRRDPARTRLGDVMTCEPSCLRPEDSVIDAMRILRDGGFRHLPVTSEDGRVVGIVSRYDFRGAEHARDHEDIKYSEVLR